MALALAFKGRTHALSLGEQHEALTLPQLSSLIEQVLPEVQGCSVKLLVPGRKALQLASSDASMLCKDAGAAGYFSSRAAVNTCVCTGCSSQGFLQRLASKLQLPCMRYFDFTTCMSFNTHLPMPCCMQA